MQRILRCFFSLFIMLGTISAQADKALLQQKDVRHFVRDMVNHYHFDKKQLVTILSEAQFQPQIIESMERPYEKKNLGGLS